MAIRPAAVVFALLSLTHCFIPCTAQEQGWPCWRGPRGDGTSQAVNVPTNWSDTENIAWKVKVPGSGHSSPILVGDLVILTSCLVESEERVVLCYDRQTGKELWQTTIAKSAIEKMHAKNTPASSTPSSDGESVYCTFMASGEYLVCCLDLNGNLKWQRSLGPFESRHGFCNVPIVHGDTLLLAGLQDNDQSFVARLNKANGDTVWKQITGTNVRSFSPPMVIEDGATGTVAVSGSECTSAFDLSTGEFLWREAGNAEKTVSSLVMYEGRLLVCGGRDDVLMAIGGVRKREPVVDWVYRKQIPYVSSPIIANKEFHMVSDAGIFTSIDPNTGKSKRKKRLLGPTSASPVLIEGRLYLVDEGGKTVVLELEPKFKKLATNELNESVFASPAVADGELFIRGTYHLYCIREVEKIALAK